MADKRASPLFAPEQHLGHAVSQRWRKPRSDTADHESLCQGDVKRRASRIIYEWCDRYDRGPKCSSRRRWRLQRYSGRALTWVQSTSTCYCVEQSGSASSCRCSGGGQAGRRWARGKTSRPQNVRHSLTLQTKVSDWVKSTVSIAQVQTAKT